jgi:two-component sensor histidine kinase
MTAVRHFQRLAEWKPGALWTAVGILVFVAAPTFAGITLRVLVGEWACFSLYFPPILLATLLLGWRAGLLVTVIAAVTAAVLLAGSPMAMGPTRHGMVIGVEYWISAALIILTAALLRSAFVQLNEAAEKERALNQELRHRVNNSLALALAFASQTLRSSPEPEVFYGSFRSRLMALARAQDILSSGNWADCQFPNLAEAALEAFAERDAITLVGAQCRVPSESCVPLVLALHELATNAVKHGALSAPGGRVALSWTSNGADARAEIVLEWIESGGPPVKLPTRRGLGSRLLTRQAGLDEVNVDYDPAGLRCTMVARGSERVTPWVHTPHAVDAPEMVMGSA